MTESAAMCMADSGVVSVYRPITELTHPMAQKAMAFWGGRPADGLVIGRDIPSRAIAELLKRIIVHEPIDDGRDLKVRLAGGAIRRRFGREITGETLSQLFPTPDLPTRLRSVMTAINEGIPQFADCVLRGGSMELIHTELVILPVFAPNQTSKWAMTVCCFFE
jgi:hypothetical protein